MDRDNKAGKTAMAKAVTATEARVHFGELLRRVSEGETVMVEKAGRLQAVVLPASEYERLVAGLEHEVWRERARLARERIRTEVGDRELPSPEEVIRTEREQRDERLGHLR